MSLPACNRLHRTCWCARKQDGRRLRLVRFIPAVILVYLTGKLYSDLLSLHDISNRHRHHPRSEIASGIPGWTTNGVSPSADVLNIVSLASGSPADTSSGDTSGNVPFNVSAAETASCWHRLRRRLGRPVSLVIVGDSRGRGLYHHLRSSWHLEAHTRRGSECLQHFVYKNRTDWCHYRASSPHADLRFFWNRLADGGLLKLLERLRTDCEGQPASCPHLLLLSMGTHQLRLQESSHSRRLLHAVSGLEMTAVTLERIAALGVRIFWKLSEPENFEMLRDLTDASLNYAHAIYNAMLTDRLDQLAPSVGRWSSVLPPTENYIARCRLDPTWSSNPFSSPQRNCYDRLHYGSVVQDQYRSQLQRHLCPAPAAGTPS